MFSELEAGAPTTKTLTRFSRTWRKNYFVLPSTHNLQSFCNELVKCFFLLLLENTVFLNVCGRIWIEGNDSKGPKSVGECSIANVTFTSFSLTLCAFHYFLPQSSWKENVTVGVRDSLAQMLLYMFLFTSHLPCLFRAIRSLVHGIPLDLPALLPHVPHIFL